MRFKQKSLTVLIRSILIGALFTHVGNAEAQPYQQQNYKIPAGDLTDVLSNFTSQAGVIFSFNSTLIEKIHSKGLIGQYDVDSGFDQILNNTGYTVAKHGDVYSLVPVAVSNKAQDSKGFEAAIIPEERIRLSTIYMHASPDDADKNLYKNSSSKVYISTEQLNRYSNISTADMLKGQSGVSVGDSRNGGGLDVNIRGVQGQSRVGVSIDGGEQMVNVYRGYSGTQQRSYVDPDLIRSIEIEKGSGTSDNEGGYIGGSVRMKTIEAQDILLDDKTVGVRIKGNLSDNSIAPNGISHLTGLGVYNWIEPRGSRSLDWSDLARSGSIAAAWKNDQWEIMAAYAKRVQGNYFSGKNGYNKYKKAHEERSQESGEQASTVTHGMFYENEEILNTSARSDSILLKAKYQMNEEQSFKIGYRNYKAELASIMPSALQRYCGRYGNCIPGRGTAGLAQWEPGKVYLNAFNLDYNYKALDNEWINTKIGLWSTYTNTNEISGANPYYPWGNEVTETLGYARMPQTAFNWGLNLRNESNLIGSLGELKWVNGIEFKHEHVKPQDSLPSLTTIERLGERVIRNATRWESSIFTQGFFKPIDNLELRAGMRYTQYGSKDLNQNPEKPLFCPNQNMCMTMEEDPQFIFKNQFDEYAKTAKFLDQSKNKDNKFAPSFGGTYYILPDTFLYANYSLSYRMPSLFETSMGTANVKTVASLDPEQAQNIEVGFSTTHQNLLGLEDKLSFKIAYFNNSYKNYITRFLDPQEYFTSSQFMYFTNLDKFKLSGFEMNASYDNEIFFADFTGNYFEKAVACDNDISQKLRTTANFPYGKGLENTPTCVDGGFGSSYAAAQNPPKFSFSLGLGTRLLDQKLTLGGRLNYTHSPITRMDQPWHKIVTTYQKFYEKSQTIDIYAKYDVSDQLKYNLNITNLTNQYYLDALTQSYMPAPGRTFSMGIEYKF